MPTLRTASGTLTAGLALIGLAAAPAALADDGEYWNPEVVTPTGNPTRISDTPSATFVITGDEVRRSGAQSLPEVLRRVPGLEVRMMSASDGQVGARGFAYELARHVLLLVDGRTAQVDFFGGNAWEILPISALDIDRIEVVLGPGAAVYGNMAMLGTINVITRSAADYPRLEAQSSVGIEGDTRVALRHGMVNGPWRTRATASVKRLSPFADDLGGRNALDVATATLHAGYSPTPSGEMSVEGGITHGLTHVNTVAAAVDPFRATLGYARADGRLGLGGPGAPRGELALRAVWSAGRVRSNEYLGNAEFHTVYHTSYVELSHSLRYAAFDLPMQLRWGGEARLNTLTSTLTSNEQDILNLAAFVSNEILLDKLRLTGGLRIDRQPLTKVIASPRLSAVYAPTRRQQLRAAVNLGYKNPSLVVSFADFVVPPGIQVVGNPELAAEKIAYAEVGHSAVVNDWLRVFTNGFAYRIRDFITRDASLALTTGQVHYGNNEAPVDGWGGEAGAHLTFNPNLSAYLTYAHVRLTGRDDFPYTADNLGSPRHKIGAGTSYETPWGLYLTADGQFFDESAVNRELRVVPGAAPEFVTTPLDAFIMVHGRLGYQLGNGVDLSFAVSNLFGRRACLPPGSSCIQFPGADPPSRRILFTLAYYP